MHIESPFLKNCCSNSPKFFILILLLSLPLSDIINVSASISNVPTLRPCNQNLSGCLALLSIFADSSKPFDSDPYLIPDYKE